jgi:sugar phosphate isomerase/epimerase
MYNPTMKRRTFIESSIATGLLASLPSRTLAALHKIDKVGVQLYTVRDDMKKDFSGTIAKVASIGYKELEFAGYFDHPPADVRAIIDKDGLTAPSCHVGYDVVQNHLPETIDAAHTVGHSFIVCPSIDEKVRKSADSWKGVTDLFNKAGEACKKAGIQFAYHNHTFEFYPDPILGGKRAYDYLLENTEANLVKMEMDLCWISTTGQDPLDYFKRFPGRFALVHVKDYKTLPQPSPDKKQFSPNTEFEKTVMTEPGSGIIDWKRIFAHAGEAGIQHFFVEHDQPADPFASLAASYKYLSTLRF